MLNGEQRIVKHCAIRNERVKQRPSQLEVLPVELESWILLFDSAGSDVEGDDAMPLKRSQAGAGKVVDLYKQTCINLVTGAPAKLAIS